MTTPDPRIAWRGRPGDWVPGQADFPALIDIRTARISEEVLGQRLFAQCMAHKHGRHPALTRLMHIPNGGSRSKREGASFKAQGVRAGIPDYFLPVPRGQFHGCWVELKALNGSLSPEQRAECEQLDRDGYRVGVCWGDDAALQFLIAYLSD